MAPNGKEPVVDASAASVRQSERHRSSERHRVKRRTRVPNVTRARIRLRIWLACTGALLVMAVGIYLMLGHDAGGNAGQGMAPGTASGAVVAHR